MTSQSQNSGASPQGQEPRSDTQRPSRDGSLETSRADEEANRPQGADWQQGTRQSASKQSKEGKEGKESNRDTSAGPRANRSGDTQSR